ncbi:hypothetical protein [Sphingomonas sp.]|uniref:hypothetical protein n=1 Tax=Sphingomonas sp. TaxID=28214 RepID=UPI001D39D179|nr:hypothetical protein [Sphingomonas sp.]MBX9795329.1 hypothetical protein [Sphingomonas sp.]
MGKKRCKFCDRTVDKVTLSRCQVSACPMQRRYVGMPRKLAVRLVLLMVGGSAAVFGGFAYFSSQSDSGMERQRAVVSAIAQRVESVTGVNLGSGDAARHAAFTLSPPDPAAASRVQNFPCDASASTSRRMVCNHWELATADYNLRLAYVSALKAVSNPASLRRSHRDWLDQLDQIGNDPEAVMNHYADRMEKLNGSAARAPKA